MMIGGSAREKREYRPVDPRRSQQIRAESSAVQSEADTKQIENETVIDENKIDKKFFKNLEQFGENKRISSKRSSRQPKATGVEGEITGKHRNFAQAGSPPETAEKWDKKRSLRASY